MRKTPYTVQAQIDEEEEEITQVVCEGCPASLGGCKHVVAFIMWLHRRTEEPSPTEVVCYWKKAVLSNVGSNLKMIEVKDFGNEAQCLGSGTFLENAMSILRNDSPLSQICKYFNYQSVFETLSVHKIILKARTTHRNIITNDISLLKFMEGEMCENLCLKVEEATREQSKSKLWYEMRYGRITASKIHEVSRCCTPDGSLVESIFGAQKFKPNRHMLRGIELEQKIINCAEKKLLINIQKCGIFLSPKFPIFGASPDGISGNCIIEVKCPSSLKHRENYIKNGVIAKKYLDQMMLQMKLCERKEGVFCVADPEFETNNNVDFYFVNYDENHCDELIEKCKKFWLHNVFPKL